MKFTLILTLLSTFFFNSAEGKIFEVLNSKVEQGGVAIVKIDSAFRGTSVCIAFNGRHFKSNSSGEVFVPININDKAKDYQIFLSDCGTEERLNWFYEEISVVEKNFTSRYRRTFIPTEKWKWERRAISIVLGNGDFSERYSVGKFIRPLEAVKLGDNRSAGDVSSPFGHNHGGVDLVTLDKRSGQYQRQVRSINNGKVAMITRNFSTDGNMVIIDHGSGIFSLYLHLSKINVKSAGEYVPRGQTIGLTGRSGSAARGGPHLHFAVKVHDVYVDPLAFIDTMNQYSK